jgi:hypothetical protein
MKLMLNARRGIAASRRPTRHAHQCAGLCDQSERRACCCRREDEGQVVPASGPADQMGGAYCKGSMTPSSGAICVDHVTAASTRLMVDVVIGKLDVRAAATALSAVRKMEAIDTIEMTEPEEELPETNSCEPVCGFTSFSSWSVDRYSRQRCARVLSTEIFL